MDKDFSFLKDEYSSETTPDERKREILNKMYENLIRRNNGSKEFANVGTLEKTNLDINILYALDGLLNQEATSNKMTETSDSVRAQLLGKNRFSPENPYPHKK